MGLVERIIVSERSSSLGQSRRYGLQSPDNIRLTASEYKRQPRSLSAEVFTVRSPGAPTEAAPENAKSETAPLSTGSTRSLKVLCFVSEAF